MRIFVTGASGWIGSATVSDLLEAGHEVVGLARSEHSAQRLEGAGAIVHRGDLDDPDDLAKAAADSDGVIHLAFQHEVAFGGDFPTAAAADRRAVEAMGAALAGSGRPLVLASGLLGLANGRVATEDDGLVPGAQIRANPAGSAPPPASSSYPSGVSASARPCCVSRRQFMETATTGSWQLSSRSLAPEAWLAMSVTAPTAGLGCTVPMRPGWLAWPSRLRLPAPSCTQWATPAFPSVRSPKR